MIEKYFELTLIVLLGVSCFMLGNIIGLNNNVTTLVTGINNNMNDITDYCAQYDLSNDWIFTQELVKRFDAKHTYNVSEYNCVNYSMSIASIGTELGLDIQVREGYPEEKNATGHAWNNICTDFEPQNNQIKDYRTEYPRRKK